MKRKKLIKMLLNQYQYAQDDTPKLTTYQVTYDQFKEAAYENRFYFNPLLAYVCDVSGTIRSLAFLYVAFYGLFGIMPVFLILNSNIEILKLLVLLIFYLIVGCNYLLQH